MKHKSNKILDYKKELVEVFAKVAERGQCSLGWFYGCKLYLIINDKGEILSFYLTKGNVDDRNLS